MSKFNFFDRRAVSSTNFEDNKFSWSFISAGIILENESTTSGDVLEYSFDAETVHGTLDPDLPTAALAFNNRHESKIYIRRQSAGSAVTVRVEAWA